LHVINSLSTYSLIKLFLDFKHVRHRFTKLLAFSIRFHSLLGIIFAVDSFPLILYLGLKFLLDEFLPDLGGDKCRVAFVNECTTEESYEDVHQGLEGTKVEQEAGH